MDQLFMACSLYRRRKFDDCVKLCTELLEKNPYDQVELFELLMRMLSKFVYFNLLFLWLFESRRGF
jgi:tetratricopeptide repeat protein 8